MALVGNTISNIFDNTAPAGPQSIFGGVGGWQNRLIAAGMGLLSGDDWQSQLRGGFGGYLQGAQQDKADKKERDKEAAVKMALADPEFMQGVPQSIAPLLSASPDMLGGIIAARLKPKDYPNSYDEFVQAQGNPEYAQFLRDRQSAATPRTYGTPEPGTRLIFDENGVPVSSEYIPGSPAARKADAEAAALERAQNQRSSSAENVVNTIDRALEKVQASPNTTAGPGGAVLQNVPGTQARDVAALITTIKANAGFDRLQAMRDASPTGGALGQVSEMELQQLNSAIANLEQSQTPEQLQQNLMIVRGVYDQIINGPNGAPPGAPVAPSGLQDLYKKYGLE